MFCLALAQLLSKVLSTISGRSAQQNLASWLPTKLSRAAMKALPCCSRYFFLDSQLNHAKTSSRICCALLFVLNTTKILTARFLSASGVSRNQFLHAAIRKIPAQWVSEVFLFLHAYKRQTLGQPIRVNNWTRKMLCRVLGQWPGFSKI
jgi:hypothetical protein